jgi:hypothetical protein
VVKRFIIRIQRDILVITTMAQFSVLSRFCRSGVLITSYRLSLDLFCHAKIQIVTSHRAMTACHVLPHVCCHLSHQTVRLHKVKPFVDIARTNSDVHQIVMLARSSPRSLR